MAAKPKFTRIPKTSALIAAGVPTEAIPTYCCLADYANNTTGLCWPKMETLATTLNRSIRTVQRHLHLLQELGLIEFVNRRRWKGRFSSYTYKILHIITTGHGRRMAKRDPNRRRTKPVPTTPKSPEKDVKNGYWWWFGEEAPPDKQEEHQRRQQAKQQVTSTEQTDRYDWFFQ